MANSRRQWLLIGGAIAVLTLAGLICIRYPGPITALFTDFGTSARIKTIQITGVALVISGGILFAVRQQTFQFLSGFSDRLTADRRALSQDIRSAVHGESQLTWLVLLGIVVIGVVVRADYLSQPIRNDEAYSLFHFASLPLLRAASLYNEPNNHILNTLLIHFLLIFGNAEWIIRLPAFCAGLVAIPLGFVVGRLLYNTSTGLLAAALIATSSALVEFSTNGRGYTLQIMFMLAALTLAIYLTRHDNAAAWLLYALMWVLGFYTLPTTLYPFGIVSLWLAATLFFRGDRPLRWQRLRPLILYTGLAGVLTLGLYAPVFFVSGVRPVINAYTVPLSWHDFFTQLPGFLRGVLAKWNRDLNPGIALILGGGIVLAQLIHRWLSRDYSLLPAIVVWSGGLLILQHTIPFFRVWLFLAPFYYLLAAAGLIYALNWLIRRLAREPISTNNAEAFMAPVNAAVIVIFGVAIGISVLTSRSVYLSDETGKAIYSPQLAAFLAGQDTPAVGVVDRWEVMLRYNLLRAGASADPIYVSNTIDPLPANSLTGKQTLYIVVPDGDTLRRVTGTLRALPDWSKFSDPQEILPLPGGMVYRALRKADF